MNNEKFRRTILLTTLKKSLNIPDEYPIKMESVQSGIRVSIIFPNINDFSHYVNKWGAWQNAYKYRKR